MNKLIEGHRYNTETAKELARLSNHAGIAIESLFRTKSGRFFIFIHGGGGHIKPISLKAAKEWGSVYMAKYLYDETFSDNQPQIKQIPVYIKETLLARLDAAAVGNKSRSDIIAEALNAYLK